MLLINPGCKNLFLHSMDTGLLNFEHYAKELLLLYQGSSPAKGHGKVLKKGHFHRAVVVMGTTGI